MSNVPHHFRKLKHNCGWDQVLSGPTVGAKCFHRLTLVRNSTSDLSPLEFVLRLLVALERGSVETEGALLVDHTDDQVSESIQNKRSTQLQTSIHKRRTFTEGLKPLF